MIILFTNKLLIEMENSLTQLKGKYKYKSLKAYMLEGFDLNACPATETSLETKVIWGHSKFNVYAKK